MALKLNPFGDQIVVLPTPESDITSGGIILTAANSEAPVRGEVLAVGPGRYSEVSGDRVPVEVKVGQQVIYKKFAGTEIEVEGQELKILRERDILVALVQAEELAAAE